ncbi:thioredoxin [Alkalihalobacterium alkalinitrilicum]|uniref:thioredoxin n=1 Tax=Alkalihalobacterium alkalinitrilicum TaxID=427920 RepID=UPI000994DAAD|nr:thioredoxin [Alkalihalobacterium alkalinitrilicum]
MAIVELTDQNFVYETKVGTVLVDFWAPWCGPCKMIAPVLVELNDELGENLRIGKVNVDHHPEITSRFDVMSIPTLILFKDGKVVEKISGYPPKEELLKLVKPYL